MKSKKGQAWGFDLVLASIIFVFAIIGFYVFAFNYSTGGEETYNNLIYEGQLIADSVLSEGHPKDWNSTNVVRIGILSENKINNTKLERFYNLYNADYGKTRVLFNINHDYYINFSKTLNIGGQNVNTIGIPNPNPKNLIRVTRLSIYDNAPITLNVNAWAN